MTTRTLALHVVIIAIKHFALPRGMSDTFKALWLGMVMELFFKGCQPLFSVIDSIQQKG